jgi:hypothetical protein
VRSPYLSIFPVDADLGVAQTRMHVLRQSGTPNPGMSQRAFDVPSPVFVERPLPPLYHQRRWIRFRGSPKNLRMCLITYTLSFFLQSRNRLRMRALRNLIM